MAVQTVYTTRPLMRAAVLAALAGYPPLVAKVRPGNRQRASEVAKPNAQAPADTPAWSVRYVGGASSLYTFNPTFGTEAVPSFNPASPPASTVRKTAEFEVVLDTTNFSTDEAQDLIDDVEGAFLYAGPHLGDASNPPKLYSPEIARVRVDDTAGDADPQAAGYRTPTPGRMRKRITVTLRMTAEIQIHVLIPREV